jgi:hypothetical protein
MSQSDELLNSSNQLMAQTNNDMWSQWNHTNVSLENRVQEEQNAKNKTQAHLEKVYLMKKLLIFNTLFYIDSSRNF